MLELQHIVSRKSVIGIVAKGPWPNANPHPEAWLNKLWCLYDLLALSQDPFQLLFSRSLMQVKTNNNDYIRLLSKWKHGFNAKWEVHLFV